MVSYKNKTKGFGKKLSIIKRIVKEGECFKGDKRFTQYHKFTYQGNEYNAFLNRHMILAIQEETFGYNECGNPLKIAQMMPSDEIKKQYVKIDIDMVELKTFAKTNEFKPYIITLDGIKYGVNPKFLLDALTFNETTTIQVKKNNPNTPIFLQNNAAKTLGIVLPFKLA